ncbi:hypothetical protein [Opitutus terrae]|uniref:Dockerin domain-containing protein n=1 Tax=Opitutus terrae (strain DSM 11246 / JCM 15787 / PB90-1) TaxID=452637 RepID=B1ZMN4_OPITP|nr:hypothetical protein [Opitutus terrae]ACB74379.1 hypothetical protein Oter_1091 [Opitutus terrae PB90-1]
MKQPFKLFLAAILLVIAGLAYWKFAFPTHRIVTRSELIMLGDLDGDHRWSKADLAILDQFIAAPAQVSDAVAWKLDLNQNRLIDSEDVRLLRALVAAGGAPYVAEESAHARHEMFPRPREFYRYVTSAEYRPRPLWALPYAGAADSVLRWLASLPRPARLLTYEDELDAAIYSEAVRFDQGWRRREQDLLSLERDYAARKLARVAALQAAGEKFELLLALIELVEDAETLTTRDQSEFVLHLLIFRDHLREVLRSPAYADFQAGRIDWRPVLQLVALHLQQDLGLEYDFEKLGPPRNLTSVENYLQRAEWQYYKSSAREEDFRALIAFAQHEPRYLRTVSRTSRRLQDREVENHNLPMVLLFREALRLTHGDKKKAAGLLDEAIRIPFGWIKSIPAAKLPGSLAYENFLLPGNKEDGADKSRHWNVFGAICLYKSPREALDLALKREMQDFRDGHYAEPELREFLRDMIGNLNGMFHVLTIDPALVTATPAE